MGFLSSLFSQAPDVDKLHAKKDIEGLLAVFTDAEHSNRLSKHKDWNIKSAEVADYIFRAARALADLGATQAIEPFIHCLKESGYSITSDEFDTFTAPAPKILASFGEPALTPLLNLLDQGFPGKQRTAAWSLGLLRDVRAVGPLAARVRRSSLHEASIWALGNIGRAEEGVSVLIDALVEGTGENSRIVHALATGQFGNAALDALERTMHRVDDDFNMKFVSYRAGAALAELGDRRGLEHLLRDANESNADTSWMPVLGRFEDERVIPLLKRILTASNSEANDLDRAMAAVGLAASGDHEAVEPLERVLSDSESHRNTVDPWVDDTLHSFAERALDTIDVKGVSAVDAYVTPRNA